MKIIHCADVHLESSMESNLGTDKAKQRREELLDTFSRMISYAKQENVSVILLAGDVFDKTHIRKTAKTRILEQIADNPEIDFLYLKGNHDMSDFLTGYEEDEIPKNLKLFSGDQWTSYDYGDVVITGMELTKDNNKNMAVNLILDETRLNIVMLHGQEANYEGKDQTYVINMTQLRNKNIDYLALGHIHGFKEEPLDERGKYCYCGCLEGRGFDECGEKGFVLLDVAEGKISSQFVPFAYRNIHEVSVCVTAEDTMKDIMGKIEEAVCDIPKKDMVKVIISGTVSMDMDVDTQRIVRTYKDVFYFFKVYDETQIEIDYESFLHDKSLKGEFIRLMQTKEMQEKERAEIIELGMKAMMGEELES